VGGAIRGDVGVEQEERYVSDAGLPDLDLHLAPRELECDLQLASVLAAHRRDGQVLEVVIRVYGVLLAFAVDGLREVTLTIEQADGDERQVQVAGRLAV